MARGRFLSNSICTNARIARAPDHAERLWIRLLSRADVEGCVPDVLDVLRNEVVPALVIEQNWNDDDILSCRQNLIDAGLVLARTDATGKKYLQLAKFHQHQKGLRRDREDPSQFKGAEKAPTSMRHQCGELAQTRGEHAADTSKVRRRIEVKEEVEGEGEVSSPPSPIPERTIGNLAGTGIAASPSELAPADILRAWREIWEDGRGKVAPVSPMDSYQVQKAFEMGTFDRWPNYDDLKAELLRTLEGMESKKLDAPLERVVCKLGQTWRAPGSPAGPKLAMHNTSEAARIQAEYDEIAKEREAK